VHVYVINLARSLERRQHITAELRRTGLDYTIISAVDGRDLDLNDSSRIDPSFLVGNSFPAGSAGCTLSHQLAYQQILKDGRGEALILEDDVTLPADLGTLLDAVAGHLTGAEVALINYASKDTIKVSMEAAVDLPCSRLLALPIDLGELVNTAAYVITREGCQRMTERATPVRTNADAWRFFYKQGFLDRIRCVVPLAVDKSPEFESTIGIYSLGDGIRARLVGPLVSHKVPFLHQAIVRRRGRLGREWTKWEIVDTPFIEKPSRLG
jgi:glycosyl transferase family 25